MIAGQRQLLITDGFYMTHANDGLPRESERSMRPCLEDNTAPKISKHLNAYDTHDGGLFYSVRAID